MTSGFRRERRRLLAQERADIDYGDLRSMVAQTEHGLLTTEQRATLLDAIDTLARVQAEVAGGRWGIRDVRRYLGWPSEKTRTVLDKDDDHPDDNSDSGEDGRSDNPRKGAKKKRPSGRRAASEYTGATVIEVHHETLSPKDDCPDSGCYGKVYPLPEPAKVIRITGMSPVAASLYRLERLRCNLCGTMYTAELPANAGDAKYDETIPAVIGILRYGHGMPHNRLEKLCQNLGVPMPSSTQWDLIEGGGKKLAPVFDELVLQAAQGNVLTIDDTHMKVIELGAKLARDYAQVEARVSAGDLPKSALAKQRTGVFTTGMISTGVGREIVLFLTGAKHAGENIQDVLTRRAAELSAPIRMADALSRNFIGDLDTIDASCLVHGRRQFVDLVGSFPDEVEYVLDRIGLVYMHERETRQMTPEERLAHHSKHSGPVMEELEQWMKRQLSRKLVEPNSGLGAALLYLEEHWARLTVFLRVAGAPLDSNVVERALKIAIRHRRNSLFYRSKRGARIGDCYMSLIHTAQRNGVNSFNYLAAVIRHHELSGASPADWMPWNYAATMTRHGLH